MGWAVRLILTGGLVFALAACAGSTPPPSTGYGSYKVGKPYRINGVWYYPKEQPNYREVGLASWYGPGFHGRRTANGEVYDMYAMTAAHTTLPMPTMVRVTNLQNGRRIVVRVNDRGPFKSGRIIDLSKRAAEELGFRHQGVARVRVEYLGRADGNNAYAQASTPPRRDPRVAQLNRAQKERVERVASRMETVSAPPVPVAAPERKVETAQVRPELQPQPMPFEAVGGTGLYYVQVGAFADPDNAIATYTDIAGIGNATIAGLPMGASMVYRVRVGPLKTQSEAERLVADFRAKGHDNAQIIVD